MKTKRLIQVSVGLALVGLWPTSCDVKDPIYDTPHPEKGTITVTIDWSDIGKETPKPSDYTVILGDESFPATGDTYTLPENIDPGHYTFYFHNMAEQIQVTGTTATVAATRAAYISPMPGWFITGKMEATIEKDKHHKLTVTMQQQVRELTLLLEPTGKTADKIESMSGELSGVAGSLDFSSNTHSAASSVPLTFTKQLSGEHTGKWMATIRLLGITGSEQKLTGTIAFEEGGPADMPLKSDLSEALKLFNENKKEPIILDGQMIETPTEVGFTATIDDWVPVEGTPGIAN